jgi:metal-responsive CopG/Arc/MetJ family transcriptional regulator
MVFEEEISRWSGFARALRKSDREAFDELMDMYRSYASERSNATNLIIFEPMVVSVLLGQQRRIRELKQKIKAMQPDTATVSLVQETKATDLNEPKITAPTATSGGGQTRFQ